MSDRMQPAASSGGRIVPASPFEVEASKEILARRIEAGDIAQSDVDLLRKGYSWMSTSAFLGSTVMGVGSYYAMKRRRPPVALGMRLLGAGSMGMIGSFLGFTVGGVAAAMEVDAKMPDSQRKMKVFAEIALESRKTIERHRVHDMQDGDMIPGQRQRPISGDASGSVRPRAMASTNGLGGDSAPTWDIEADEKRMEADRQHDFQGDLNRISSDSGFARESYNNASGTSYSISNGNSRTSQERSAGEKENARATTGTWDRIRLETLGKAPNASREGVDVASKAGTSSKDFGNLGAGVGKKPDQRTKEQREFDEMLERERQGVKEDKWA